MPDEPERAGRANESPGGRGRRPERDVPQDLRDAAREYRKLLREGEPVPEDVLEKVRRYGRRCRKEQAERPLPPCRRPEREDVPEDLRGANREYQRRRRKGLPISDELRALVAAYQRACYRGRPKRLKKKSDS